MADTIRVNTELLNKCAGELKQMAQGFGDAASLLSGLNTGEEWWSKAGRFVSFRLDDEGGTAEMGDAGASVRAMTALMRRYDGRLAQLGAGVGKAAAMFCDVENSLCAIANGQQPGEEGNVIGEGTGRFGGASGGGGQTGAEGGESKGSYHKETEWSPFGWRQATEWEDGERSGSSEFRFGGGKKDWISESAAVAAFGFKSKADDKTEYDRHGKELAKDKNGEYVDGAEYTDKYGNPTDKRASAKRKGTLAEVSEKVSADYSVVEGKASIENEKGSVSAEVHGLRVQGYAEGKGGVYFDEVKHGDNKSGHLEIGMAAGIGASVTVLEASMEGTYKTPVEGVDVHGKVSSKLGTASADASAQAGIVDGKMALYAGASAEANLAEVGGEVGVKVGGVDATVGGEVVVGVGAHANAGYYDGVMKVDVGASIGIGATVSFEVDVSDLVENVKKNEKAIKQNIKSIEKQISKGYNTYKNIKRGLSRGFGIW